MSVQTVNISDEEIRKIMLLPILTTSLPYCFGNGGRIASVSIACACCDAELEPESLRAEFSQVEGGRNATLKGYGLCYACKTITPFEVRFADDGSALCRSSDGWTAMTWGDAQDTDGFLTITGRFFRLKWKEVLPPMLALVLILAWKYLRYA